MDDSVMKHVSELTGFTWVEVKKNERCAILCDLGVLYVKMDQKLISTKTKEWIHPIETKYTLINGLI